MADDFLNYVPGIPIDQENFENNMHQYNLILEDREKSKRTLEILNNRDSLDDDLNSLHSFDTDEDIKKIKKTTDKVSVTGATIQAIHPGIDVYSKGTVGCLFSSKSLSLDKFGIALKTKHFYGSESNELLSMLKCHVNMQCVDDPGISRYLFYLMSIHEDAELVENCQTALTGFNNLFKPTLNDIFAVFVNWGCTEDILYPEFYNITFQLPQPLEGIVSNEDLKYNDLTNNVQNVLLYLQNWTSDMRELKALIRMLLLSSLERRFRLLSINFYECIHAILNGNKCSVEEVSSFVEILHFKDTHFHNQAQASISMMGNSEFAILVSTCLAYASLQQLLDHKKINYVQKVGVHHLSALNLDVIPGKSYYEIHTIVWLLKICMTNLQLEDGYKEYFKMICSWLKSLKESLRKGTTICDEQTLNEFISRILNCLSCDYMRTNAGELPRYQIL
ncbi:SMC5-SMC6 complex localization factor protein 2 [Anabrus simplex]|uniref:SMC5-SMC6 complex localization factor protein 2 n=1 Tax=Anabrus simplex TaxID=316456 RepID=UPI0034DD3E1B